MNNSFKVKSLEHVSELAKDFFPVETELIPVSEAYGRVLAQDVIAPENLPGFRRATMDGFALAAQSSFGASESSPAWLEIAGNIRMGDIPDFKIKPGKAAGISTGGMLPEGADSVVMVEHTELVGNSIDSISGNISGDLSGDISIEVYKSVAPLQNVIDASEDFAKDEIALKKGTYMRPQEQGLAAGLGFSEIKVYKRPKIAIISTGDEIIPIEDKPGPGKIRDINTYTLSGFVREAFADPVIYGIVKDDLSALKKALEKAVRETDMILISGGSSVGTRDFTVDAISALPDSKLLVHGIAISPGKPTILAKAGKKPIWGLPGQVASAMVVLKIVIVPFINHIKGLRNKIRPVKIPAVLSRNIASARGRRDFIRISLEYKDKQIVAKPVLGKSGLIRTMYMRMACWK